MKIEIKHWVNARVLFYGEFGSLKMALEVAVQQGAGLKGALIWA